MARLSCWRSPASERIWKTDSLGTEATLLVNDDLDSMAEGTTVMMSRASRCGPPSLAQVGRLQGHLKRTRLRACDVAWNTIRERRSHPKCQCRLSANSCLIFVKRPNSRTGVTLPDAETDYRSRPGPAMPLESSLDLAQEHGPSSSADSGLAARRNKHQRHRSLV